MEDSVIKKYLITAADGKGYNTNHYNLQAIISVGFKVNNERAVQFRKWAGQIVKDYTIQGWTMDVERLKKVGCSLMNILTVSFSNEILTVFSFARRRIRSPYLLVRSVRALNRVLKG